MARQARQKRAGLTSHPCCPLGAGREHLSAASNITKDTKDTKPPGPPSGSTKAEAIYLFLLVSFVFFVSFVILLTIWVASDPRRNLFARMTSIIRY